MNNAINTEVQTEITKINENNLKAEELKNRAKNALLNTKKKRDNEEQTSDDREIKKRAIDENPIDDANNLINPHEIESEKQNFNNLNLPNNSNQIIESQAEENEDENLNNDQNDILCKNENLMDVDNNNTLNLLPINDPNANENSIQNNFQTNSTPKEEKLFINNIQTFENQNKDIIPDNENKILPMENENKNNSPLVSNVMIINLPENVPEAEKKNSNLPFSSLISAVQNEVVAQNIISQNLPDVINAPIKSNKKITFTEAKREIEEFTNQIEKYEEDIKEKYGINISELYAEDYLPDELKIKLIEDFFSSDEVVELIKKSTNQ